MEKNNSLMLLTGDLIAASGALIFTGKVIFDHQVSLFSFSQLAFLPGLVVVQVLTLTLAGFHSRQKKYSDREILARISLALLTGIILLGSLHMMLVGEPDSYSFAVVFVFLAILFQILWHKWQRSWRPSFARKIIILGTGPLARQIGSLVANTGKYALGGYINCASEPNSVPSYAVVGRDDALVEAITREKAHKLIISLSERRGVFPLRHVLDCKLRGIEVVDAPSFYEQLTGKLFLESITPAWLIFSRGFRLTSLLRLIKRVMDICCASAGILLFLPFFPIVALAIKLDSKGPLFFRQIRVGEGESEFVLYKFRTMVADAESKTGAVWASEGDPRVTRIGNFLRKSRIDEVPQLFNVLRGDMSFVGPRPERPEFVAELKKIIPFYSERHIFKPGVTGWAQVSYPYGASIEDAIEKLRYDLYYIKNFSLLLDIRIIARTVNVVLFRKGGR